MPESAKIQFTPAQSAAITASRQAEHEARGRGMYSKKMMEVIKDGNDREMPKKRGKWK